MLWEIINNMRNTTISISDENKEMLVQLGGIMQMKKRRKITMNEVIGELIDKYKGDFKI